MSVPGTTDQEQPKTEVKVSKREQLNIKNSQAKTLREEQKVLRNELNANKDERAVARKTQSQCRKSVQEGKSNLAKLTSVIYSTFSKGTAEEIKLLADSIKTLSTDLIASVNDFADAKETLEDL